MSPNPQLLNVAEWHFVSPSTHPAEEKPVITLPLLLEFSHLGETRQVLLCGAGCGFVEFVGFGGHNEVVAVQTFDFVGPPGDN